MLAKMRIQESPKHYKPVNEVTNIQDSDARKPHWPMTVVRTWASDDEIKYVCYAVSVSKFVLEPVEARRGYWIPWDLSYK